MGWADFWRAEGRAEWQASKQASKQSTRAPEHQANLPNWEVYLAKSAPRGC